MTHYFCVSSLIGFSLADIRSHQDQLPIPMRKSPESYLCLCSCCRSCDSCLITRQPGWKAFIYLLNRWSFNDTWVLQFLGNFFVITDKFIILTIKLIKRRAHSNCFLREGIFGATETSPAPCPELSPACCPGPLCLRARGGGKRQAQHLLAVGQDRRSTFGGDEPPIRNSQL